MRTVLAGLVALALCGAGRADEIPIGGDKSPGKAGVFAKLSVPAKEGDTVTWFVFPQPLRKEGRGGDLYLSGKDGVAYTVMVTVVNFDTRRNDSGQLEYVFGAADPVVPPPKPIDPKKPDPPVPPPAAVDPELVAAFKATVAADVARNGAAEKVWADKLGGVYEQAAVEVAKAADGTLTLPDCYSAMFRASDGLKIPRRDAGLQATRDEIGRRIAATALPTPDPNLPLAGPAKAAVAAMFARVGSSLREAVKQP